MSFARWLAKYFPQLRSSRRAARARKARNRKPARRTVPQLEFLEERMAPATLTVNSTSDSGTITTALTLREAMTLINTGGSVASFGLAAGATAVSTWGAALIDIVPNNWGKNDTIVFSPTVFNKATTITLTNGELPGISESMDIQGPAAALTITGNGMNRVFQAYGAPNKGTIITATPIPIISMSDLTVTDGFEGAATSGGAIFNAANMTLTDVNITKSMTGTKTGGGGGIVNYGSLALNDCTLSGNTSGGPGGAIANYGPNSTANLYGTTLSGNTSYSQGGAIANFGTGNTTTLTDCTVTGSITTSGAAYSALFSNGGGLTLDSSIVTANKDVGITSTGGSLTLSYSSVTGNTGSGIVSTGATTSVTISDSTISGNTSTLVGGGLDTSVPVTIKYSTISGNKATGTYGGGIYSTLTGTLTLTDSTVAYNSSKYNGGGLFLKGKGTITYSTIADNSATSTHAPKGEAGGIYSFTPSDVTLGSSLVASNIAGSGVDPDVEGTFISSGFNLIGNVGSGTGFSATKGDIAPTTGVNPLLSKLDWFGGPTETIALLSGSPVLGAGNPTPNPLITLDQRGLPRIVSGKTDIGAFQTQASPYVVNTSTDQGANDCPGGAAGMEDLGQVSLRNAINLSNDLAPSGGAAITFTAGVTGQTINLAGVELTAITQDVKITGPGENSLFISGGNTSRIFEIDNPAFVTITGLTIENGNSNTAGGGGIWNKGSLTLQNSEVTGCTAGPANTYGGGGILNDNTLKVYNSLISGNSVTGKGLGGGIDTYGAQTLLETLIENTTVSGNTAPNSNGGGIAVQDTDNVQLLDSTITGNNGSGIRNSNGYIKINGTYVANNRGTSGGGIYAYQGELKMIDSTVSGNNATAGGGGGIANYDGSTLNIYESTIANNTSTGTDAARGIAAGGGIVNVNGADAPTYLNLTGCTITGNTAKMSSGGGVYSIAHFTLSETIVAGNKAPAGYDFGGTIAYSNGYNLIGNSSFTGTFDSSTGDQIGVAAPLLGKLGNYGGPTPTVPLLPGSPAIDAGNEGDTSPDQRGEPVYNGRHDIGAFESQGFTITVNAASNNQQTPINDAFKTALTVTVKANNSVEPVSGGVVTFIAPAGGPSAGFSNDTPTIAANGTATVTATANGNTGAYTVTASASGAPTDAVINLANFVWTPASLPVDTVGLAYNQIVTPTGGTATLTYKITSVTTPANLGLTFSTATPNELIITGPPTASGTVTFTVTATSALGAINFNTENYTILVNPLPGLPTTTLPETTVGVAYDQTIAVIPNTGTGAVSLRTTVVSGTFPPPGLAFTVTGNTLTIIGRPTAADTLVFDLTATDSLGAKSIQAYTLTVNPLIAFKQSNSAPPVDTDTVGVYFSQTITASGGTPTVVLTHSVQSGTVPMGLNVTTVGSQLTVAGTPLSAATFTIQVTATDAVGSTLSQSYTFTVNPSVVLTPGSLPLAVVGTFYSEVISASGGTGALTVTYPAGTILPSGITITKGAGELTIAGTASTMSSVSFNVTATDSLGGTTIQPYTLTVNPPITFSLNSLPVSATTVGVPYFETITATGGIGASTISFKPTNVVVPAGLSLVASGNSFTLSGTPTAAGSLTFQAIATDTALDTATETYSLVVNSAVAINPTGIPNGTAGAFYNQTLFATGGTGALTLTPKITAGSLPTGLTAIPTGTELSLSGTPATSGSFALNLTVTDAVGASATEIYNVTINTPVSLSAGPLPATTIGKNFSTTIAAGGGTGTKTLTYTPTSGTLPTGLSFTADTNSLTISGVPTAARTFSFKVTATDIAGGTATQTYTVTVNGQVELTPTLAPAMAAAGYNQSIVATGGTGTKTFTYTTVGTVPAGILFTPGSNTLAVTGSPLSAGSFTLNVVATDAVGATATQSYSIVVYPTITLTALSLPATTAGVAYYETIGALHGDGNKAIAYSVVSGSKPGGLLFTTSANMLAITGKATGSGNVTFTLTATDAAGYTISQNYTLVVNSPLSLSSGAPPASTVGVAYNRTIAVGGGTGVSQVTYSVTSGKIPTGLKFVVAPNSLTISGTPTVAGSFTFKVTATDSVGATTTATYTLLINPAISLSTKTLPKGTVGANYSQPIVATGGTGTKTFSYSVVSGSLPLGLSILLDPNELIVTGKPTGHGTITIKVTATDSLGASTTETLTLTV